MCFGKTVSRFESESGDRGLQLTGILWYKEDAIYTLSLYRISIGHINEHARKGGLYFLFEEGIRLAKK